MANKTGILTVKDLLEVEGKTVAEFGMEETVKALQTDLDVHNGQVVDMVSTLATPTTKKISTYGAVSGGDLQEVDGQGRAPTQTTSGFSAIAFPLRKFQFNLGWTNDFIRKATPADLGRQMINAQTRHRVGVMAQIKRALFVPTNYVFEDFLDDDAELTVRRLLNGDGLTVPQGPNGESFDAATHSHYDAIDFANATSTQRNDAVTGLVTDVVEHGHGARPLVVIARGDEAKMKLVDDFEPYLPVQVVRGTANDRPAGVLDTMNLYNRAIGILQSSGTEVWVKPWGVPNYPFCTDIDAPAEAKPLAFRQPEDQASRGLAIKSTIDIYPLVAQVMEDEFGFGAKQRTNGAVLFLGGPVYTAPTF